MHRDPAYAALFALPVAERLQLVEDLWDSIAADQEQAPVMPPEVLTVLRERQARYEANPDDVLTWDEVKRQLHSGE